MVVPMTSLYHIPVLMYGYNIIIRVYEYVSADPDQRYVITGTLIMLPVGSIHTWHHSIRSLNQKDVGGSPEELEHYFDLDSFVFT